MFYLLFLFIILLISIVLINDFRKTNLDLLNHQGVEVQIQNKHQLEWILPKLKIGIPMKWKQEVGQDKIA